MLTAQRDSIRLLRWVLAASVVLPLTLFIGANWVGYANNAAVADRQIDQSRDIVTEHALKVFETVERSLAEVNEIVRDMSDSQISANEAELFARFKRLADSSDQLKSIWLFDRTGHTLANSMLFPTPTTDLSDRDYFKAHIARDIGIYVGEVLQPRAPFGGAPFFGVSYRRSSADGSFAGVVQASVLPDYFEGFYAKIADEAGEYAALIRDDGAILARLPALDHNVAVGADSELLREIETNPAEGVITTRSPIDGIERKIAYRKLPRFPVYVLSGLETRAIRGRWLAQMGQHLIFGLPATLALIAIVALALSRTQKLYVEAGRRQIAENALKQSQRLESLGRLTGGVAHDFNNLLMVVGGSVQKMRRRHSDPQDLRTLDMIDAAVTRGTSLTRQLLSFSRRHSVSSQVIDLSDRIETFRDVMKQSVQSDITIEIETPGPGIMVRIDPNEFEFALLNLALNARDAMPNGGKITIAVKTATLDQAGPNGLIGDVAIVAFSDTGSGIPDDIRERIFEPFFTTKPVDRGTGLGLSQIYGFAQQSSGAITVNSVVGRGTTFELTLPRCTETPRPNEEVAPPPSARPTNPTTLLLVEDHPDVSAVAADYAQQCGFNVILASSAEDAVALLNRRSDINLVFSDIVMPGMSGLELGRLIREHHPETPVVLASGYSDRAATAVQEGFTLLQKPYSMEALRKSLTQAIAQGK
jgi:two-component system NtrC family sensor kinase